ncbi:DUF5986 family protein [Paenibacillus sp. S150]|uniref:DUF5986 family protein n=1 Tax=Paenibacillus sp. S150 TaxID=2749826 RepID=UPI001C59B7A8|nr:DUF5986 family protein [Paenibacillus sp. S150]MBW4084095.1 hypothetical protein [Paenibacillus sp. S150]
MHYVIPMDDSDKTLIIDAVVQANKRDIHDFKLENDFKTFVSKHFLKWDFINKNVTRTLNPKYQCIGIERGSLWEFVLIFNQATGCAYALMNEKRFYQLRERKVRDKVHYIDALASVNTDVVSRESEQLNLFEVDNSDWEEAVNAVLKKMAFPIIGELKRFVLVTFKTEKGEMKSVNSYIPTPDLRIAHEENWNDFIAPDYSTVFSHEAEAEANQDEEIVLGLKKGIIPLPNDNIVQLRQDSVEKKV